MQPADARGILEQLAAHGTPSPGVARRIDVGSEPYLAFFERELLAGLIEPGGSACRIYEGAYGAGKTHLLQLLAETALQRRAAVVQADLSHDLQLSDWRGLLQHILQEVMLKDGAGEVHRGLAAILMELDWDPSYGEALRQVRAPHSGFREAMRAAISPDLAPAAAPVLRRFLLGETIRAGDLKRHGIHGVKGPLTHRNAERVLQTLGICLAALDVPALVILFDETEQMLAHKRQVATTLAGNLLRRLIDGSTAGRLTSTFMAFAVLPGTIEQASLVYPALGQRLRVLERARGGYRRPVLDIAQLNTCRTPSEFVDAAASRICGLASEVGSAPVDLLEKLRHEGRAVIESNASGYRRPLFKQLAATALSNV